MTYQFPVIRHLDDLMTQIADCDYLVASKKENGTTTVCYIYTDKESFSNEWERECRGITFDRDGNIASRTLHKFFNLNEREAYSVKNLDFTKVKGIFPKLDGSMISSCVLDDKVAVKSKNSFFSDVAVKAQAYIERLENDEYERFCRDMAYRGLTPTFEYTAPDNRIVVSYDVEEMTLLQVRDNVTGEYLDIHKVSKGYDIKVLDFAYDNTKDIEELVREMEDMTDIEGFIVMFEDGDMVKIKCPWYIGLHHSVTFVRERDIARLVCDQSLDDFRGLVTLGNYNGINMDHVDQIEKTLLNEIRAIESDVESWLEKVKEVAFVGDSVDFKAASAFLSKELTNDQKYLFVFIMNSLRGKETDYLTFYRRNWLKSRWGLDQIR